MNTRRELLQASLGLGLLASSPAWSFAPARFHGSIDKDRLAVAICDLRYPEGIRFGDRARRLGIACHTVRQNVTSIWMQTLRPAWRREPDAGLVMGLSGFDVLFCLEMMAHDHGHRVVYRAHHRPDATGTTIHEDVLPESRAEELPPRQWGGELAARLVHRLERPLRRSDAERCRAVGAVASLDLEDLVSWIIAPTAMLERIA